MTDEDFSSLFPIREVLKKRLHKDRWCPWLRFLEWRGKGRAVVLEERRLDSGAPRNCHYTLAWKEEKLQKVIVLFDYAGERYTLYLHEDGSVEGCSLIKHWRFLNKKWEFIQKL